MKILFVHINKKRISVIAGVMLAFAIVTTQSLTYSFVEQHVEVSQKADDDAAPVHADQYLTQDAISAPGVQLNYGKPFQVVFEFFLSDEDEPETEYITLPINQNFLQRIFRVVISPNAP